MDNTIKLYRISAWLDKDGCRKRVALYDATETPASYQFHDAGPRRLAKSKLLMLDSNIREMHMTYSAFTYCLETDLVTAQRLVEQAIHNTVLKVQNEIALIDVANVATAQWENKRRD